MVLKDPMTQPHVLLHLSYQFEHLCSMFRKSGTFVHAVAPVWFAFGRGGGGWGVAVRQSGHEYELWSWLTLFGIPAQAPTSCVNLDKLCNFSKPCSLHLKTCIVESIKWNNRHFILSTVPCTQYSVNGSYFAFPWEVLWPFLDPCVRGYLAMQALLYLIWASNSIHVRLRPDFWLKPQTHIYGSAFPWCTQWNSFYSLNSQGRVRRDVEDSKNQEVA